MLYAQLRANRLGSDKKARERRMAVIETLLRHNGFPRSMIQRTKQGVIGREGAQHANNTHKRNEPNNDTTYISLPYIDETLARRVTGAIRTSGLQTRVAWISWKTLAKHKIRSALENPPCLAGTRKCNTCEAGLAGRCHTKIVVCKTTCKLRVKKTWCIYGCVKKTSQEKVERACPRR